MMEAVGRKKAHRLFNRASADRFVKGRRPQEDLVTSAVFGSIDLLTGPARRRALELVVGKKAINALCERHDDTAEIGIEFWKRLERPAIGPTVEPDILLNLGKHTVVVEVKWHSQLGTDQLASQVEAVRDNNLGPIAIVALGATDQPATIARVPCTSRTWRDVSGAIQTALNSNDSLEVNLSKWVARVFAFLHETDNGRIFNGLLEPSDLDEVQFVFQERM